MEPDFLANSNFAEMEAEFYFITRRIINSTVAMAVRLFLKVLLKFLKGAKGAKSDTGNKDRDREKQTGQNEETNKSIEDAV